jgi:hypothetical protein
MEDAPEGLPDKLYWRRARGEWHCFRKLAQIRGYVSLANAAIPPLVATSPSRSEVHFMIESTHEYQARRAGHQVQADG